MQTYAGGPLAEHVVKPAIDMFNKIAGDLGVSRFQDDTADWWAADVEYRRTFGWGSLLGRVNWARRFGNTGFQYEVDAYPRLPHRTYLYLNIGFSSDPSLFPDLRYAAEAHHSFPKGWEASLGFRRLEFSSSNVTIVTGTAAKYYGNWWISLRPKPSSGAPPGWKSVARVKVAKGKVRKRQPAVSSTKTRSKRSAVSTAGSLRLSAISIW